MNDKNTQETPTNPRGERIASGIMKSLAIIGLIAALTLAAWLAVQLVRTIPNAGARLQGAVVAVQSMFRETPRESLAFAIDNRNVPANEEYRVTFEYTGEAAPEEYLFSYSCADNVRLEVETGNGWENLACEVSVPLRERSFSIIPQSDSNRFVDVNLTIAAREGMLSDTTLVTIVNDRIADSRSTLLGTTTPRDTDQEGQNGATGGATNGAASDADRGGSDTGATSGAATQAPVARPTVVTPIRPTVTPGPSDLAVNILETGIMAPVQGKNVLFPLPTIPADKTAGVSFTVTNKGGEPSGAWAFIAYLPIEGNPTYRYTSPAQDSLPAGAEVEFTLGFDEVLKRSTGTIKIELVPTKTTDPRANNIDQVAIKIKH